MSSYTSYTTPPTAQPQPFAAPPGQQIQPGQITYTTTTDAQGRVTYHPFRAEPASYRTSQGIVNGIQWIPVEATQVMPAGAQPAGPDFTASWNRGYVDRDQDRSLREWQKDEEKRRRKEEKDAAKRNAAWEKDRLARERAEEKELRKARERDSLRGADPRARERRLSSAGYGPPGELERQFADLGVGQRERRISTGPSYGAGYPAGGAYGGAGYPGGAYPPSPRRDDITFARPGGSPYRRASPLPSSAGGTMYYPAGHILEGQPMPPGQSIPPRSHSPMPRSHSPMPRSHSPMPGGYGGGAVAFPVSGVPPSPRPGSSYMPTAQSILSSPDAFSRPMNRAQTFAPFDLMKLQDMNDFLKTFPRLPPVVGSHDISIEDWNRLMNDLALAWTERLPLSGSNRTLKRSSVVADLIDLWNGSFFLARGVELVLYKGRECRSGRFAGRPEMRLPRIESSDDDSLASSSSEASLSDTDEGSRYGYYGSSSRHVEGRERWAAEMREARRYRREHRAEKKRRARERKLRRKEREKTYSLYVRSISPREYSTGSYGH